VLEQLRRRLLPLFIYVQALNLTKEPATNRMRQVAPARDCPLFYDLETRGLKSFAPFSFTAKGAFARAPAPLAVVNAADKTIPPRFRNIFVNKLPINQREARSVIH
jgi:hypothetical protein